MENPDYYIPEEKNLKELLMEAPIGMIIIKCPEMEILMANRMALSLRYPEWQDVRGKLWYEVFPEYAAQGFDKIIHKVMVSGETFTSAEMPVKLLRDGKEHAYYINLTYQPLKDKEGKVTAIAATGFNVTEFVIARQKIEESESKYRGLFQKMNQAFAIIQVIFDDQRRPVDYKFLEVNPAFEEHTGVNAPIGKTVRQLVPSIESYWIEAYSKVALTGESVTFVQDSSELGKTYEVHAYKVDKHTDRVAIIFTDISERRKAEQESIRFANHLESEVKERTRELERVNADLKRFAHVASHDLREPMRKVSTFNSLIREEYGSLLPERALTFLAKIDSAISRAKAMIDGVHDYMSGDILVTNFEPVNLNEIIENVKNVLGKLIKMKDAQFNVDNLPVIEAIPALIQRLFCNLVHNSLKFSRKGTPPLITISYEPVRIGGRDLAKIVVTDNGIGFDSVYSEKIFEPFTRLNPKDHYEGAGLGLAFCRKIANWHNGTITATGQINKGASFYIILPYKQEDQ